jgi:membrane-bound ClpP family serine protease
MRPTAFDAPIYAATVIVGVALIVLARWAARRPGTRWESLVALRIGDVLFTEMLGAFMVGFGIGALISPQLDDGGPPGPAGRPGPPSRFGGAFSRNRLPFILGLVLAAIAAVVRIDWTDHLLRGPAAHSTRSSFIGWDARVVAPIRAGEYGEIALPDGSGNVMSVVATADTDIALGTHVRVTGTKDLNLVVAPIAPS